MGHHPKLGKRTGKEFELETLEERILLSGDPLLDPGSALVQEDEPNSDAKPRGPVTTDNDVLLASEAVLESGERELRYQPDERGCRFDAAHAPILGPKGYFRRIRRS